MKNIKSYVESKRLTRSSRVIGDDIFELYSYSKQEFFAKDAWDEVTLSHRGKLYRNGKAINNPMRKIFNVGERPETELKLIEARIKNERYDVFDKANGHLFFFDVFDGGDNHISHTKGTLSSEMIDADNVIFDSCGYPEKIKKFTKELNGIKTATFMFEAIVEHDKHTCYRYMCNKYYENDFVLLAVITEDYNGNVHDYNYHEMLSAGMKIGCLVVSCELIEFNHDIMKMKDGIEGFVVRFENGDRVKIKTDDYWKARLSKELRPENIIKIWAKGGVQRVHDKIPEEVADNFIASINDIMTTWYIDTYMRRLDDMFYVDVIEIPYSEMSHAEIIYY